MLRSDNGREFTSSELLAWLAGEGVEDLDQTAPAASNDSDGLNAAGTLTAMDQLRGQWGVQVLLSGVKLADL